TRRTPIPALPEENSRADYRSPSRLTKRIPGSGSRVSPDPPEIARVRMARAKAGRAPREGTYAPAQSITSSTREGITAIGAAKVPHPLTLRRRGVVRRLFACSASRGPLRVNSGYPTRLRAKSALPSVAEGRAVLRDFGLVPQPGVVMGGASLRRWHTKT